MMTGHKPLVFEKPTIAPRTYIVKGPSGWVETFDRKLLDEELRLFLDPIPIASAVDMFIQKRELDEDKREPVNWETIIGHLGRLVRLSPFAIPPKVAIAFWGQVELAGRSRGAN